MSEWWHEHDMFRASGGDAVIGILLVVVLVFDVLGGVRVMGEITADVAAKLRRYADVLVERDLSEEPTCVECCPPLSDAEKHGGLVAAPSPARDAGAELRELNGWRELGEELGRIVSLMPKETWDEWFPD